MNKWVIQQAFPVHMRPFRNQRQNNDEKCMNPDQG